MSVTLLDVLVDIPDPRRAEGKRHPLPQVLLFCILGNLCGAHSYKRMAAFIRKHFPVLKAHFPLSYPLILKMYSVFKGLSQCSDAV
jgi:hypothetical protein